jgi:hypothetical protein
VATFLATPSSANLAAALTDETGSGAAVFATSPTLVTPALGTPSALVCTNCSGTAASLTAGNVTTNANLTGDVTSSGNATTFGVNKNLKAAYDSITADSDGATITFDLSLTNIHTVTLGGNRTLALSNVVAGKIFLLRLLQDGTGSRTVTWFTTILWPAATAPTLTTTASKADLFGCLAKTASTFDCFTIGQNL